MWWSKPNLDVKSERLQESIERFELKSERLISWAQLGIGLFLFALYMAAPRPVDPVMVQPVPLALAAYLVFTAGRLFLSYRIRLPALLLVVSILADIALVYGLVWYFHIQYGQDAAFSLRAPTFMYVFALIALRALRFDPIWVLATGLVAAGGWIAMTALALETDGAQNITRSFTAYMHGEGILIGAEIDKIVALFTLTSVLALGIFRSKRLLGRATQEQLERAEIRRFLPADVESAITHSQVSVMAGDAVERNAAIIFLDIRGFTDFAHDQDPQRVVEVLVSLHAIIVPIIERRGGIVDKYLGDGLLASFGAARPISTPAADGLAAISEIMAAADAWSNEHGRIADNGYLELNGAMTAGRVVFAALGDDKRLEYTVIGDIVNLAAKLEKHNKTEGSTALTTQATLNQALAEGFDVETIDLTMLGPRPVAGVAEPIDLVRLDPRRLAIREVSDLEAELPNRDDRSPPVEVRTSDTSEPAE